MSDKQSHRLSGKLDISHYWGNPAKRTKHQATTAFIPNQRLVIQNLLGFTRYFIEPKGFVPKFYHSIIDFPPRQWTINGTLQLIGGYCIIDYTLNSHYQPTIRYILNNKTTIPTLYQTIQTNYQSLLHEQVMTQLEAFGDTLWLQESYQTIVPQVVKKLSDFMARQHIRFRSHLDLQASFTERPENNDETLNDHFMHKIALRQIKTRAANFSHQQKLDEIKEEHERQKQDLSSQEESLRIDQSKLLHERTRTEIENSLVDETATRESYKRQIEARLVQQEADHSIFKIKETERRQTEIDNTQAEESVNREIYKNTLQAQLIADNKIEQAQHKQNLMVQEEALQMVQAELELEIKRTQAENKKLDEAAKRETYKHEIEAQLIVQQAEHAIFKAKELEREQMEEMEYRQSLKDKKSRFLQEEIELLLMHQEKHALEQEVQAEAQALNQLR